VSRSRSGDILLLMVPRSSRAVLSVFALVLVGCHSSGASVSPDGDAVTAEAYCEGYEAVIVDALVRCYGFSRAAALAGVPGVCASFTAAVAAGKILFEPTRAAACLAALPAYETCPGEPASPLPSACAKVTTSNVPVGAACDDFYGGFPPAQECQGNAFCYYAVGSCEAKCTAYLPVGAACDPLSSEQRCLSLASCDVDAKVCVKLATNPKLDQPCDPTGACGDGLHCDAASKRCRGSKPAGASCGSDLDCNGFLPCRGPDGAKVCTSRKQEGETCTPGADECAYESVCGVDGTCTIEGVALGAPCGFLVSTSEYVFCAADARCDDGGGQNQTGVCRAFKVAGDSCAVDQDECGGHLATCDATTLKCTDCPP
jgi:hypothetical protein